MNGCVILLEADENQHEYYAISCEIDRMNKVVESLLLEGNTLPIKWKRYNPDTMRVDGQTVKVLKRDRESRLLKEILSTRNNFDGVQIQYMYYDVSEEQNIICRSPEFRASGLLDCVLQPIF